MAHLALLLERGSAGSGILGLGRRRRHGCGQANQGRNKQGMRRILDRPSGVDRKTFRLPLGAGIKVGSKAAGPHGPPPAA
jgi:hypothetical protein